MFVYAVIGLRVFRIHQAITVWLRRQSIRHLTGVLSFHRTTKLPPHSLFYSMTFSITERVCIRSHWPSGIPYPPGDNSLVAATINSPPDRCSFVPSTTKLPPHSLFYSMTFSNTKRVPCIRSHWPSGTPYPPGDDKSGCGDDQFAT